MHAKFIAALFTIAKTWKQPKCPSTDTCVYTHIHTHNGVLLALKNKILPFAATWMDWRALC